jgi:hypothetical protein
MVLKMEFRLLRARLTLKKILRNSLRLRFPAQYGGAMTSGKGEPIFCRASVGVRHAAILLPFRS